MRNEISNFKINKEKYRRTLTQKNNKTEKKMKEDVEREKKEYYDDLRTNFIKGYRRAFSRIKYKLDLLKMGIKEGFLQTEIDYPYAFEFTGHKVKLPKAKLNIKNVYSRLYNNTVILPKDLDNNDNENNKKMGRRRTILSKKENDENMETPIKKIRTRFRLKNALSSNHGKEFTIKINNSLFKKCLDKYSGGPETIKYL